MGLALCTCQAEEEFTDPMSSIPVIESRVSNFQLDTITTDLFVPFGMDWLPDGQMLITERPDGKLSLLDPEQGELIEVCNLPPVHQRKYVGMMDVLVDHGRRKILGFTSPTQSDGQIVLPPLQ